MSEIDQWLSQMMMADGKPMSQQRIEDVFGLVKPQPNWKMPIDAVVPKGAATPGEITTAVICNTGSVPEVYARDDEDAYRVIAPGYYAAVGA